MLLRPPSEKKRSWLTPFYDRFNSIFSRVTDSYMGVATLFSRKLIISLGGLVIIVVLMGGLFGMVPSGFVPEEDQGYFLVNVQLPDAASLERTDRVTAKVETILGQAAGVESVTSVGGYSLLTASLSPNNAFLFVSLKHWSERNGKALHVKSIIQKVNQQLALGVPEAMAFAFGPPAIPGLGTGSGFSMMLQDRGGKSPGYLSEQTVAFMDAARQRPEIGNIISTFRANVPQIYADVNNDQVMKLGVSPSDVNTTLGAFLGGAYVNDFNRFGRLYKVYVQAEPEYRSEPSDIRYFFVRSTNGEVVPLSTLVETSPTQGPEYTNRFNLFRASELTGAPAAGYSSDPGVKCTGGNGCGDVAY